MFQMTRLPIQVSVELSPQSVAMDCGLFSVIMSVLRPEYICPCANWGSIITFSKFCVCVFYFEH